MSSSVRAIVLRDLTDRQCVEEALKELGVVYEQRGTEIVLENGVKIAQEAQGLRIRFRTETQQAVGVNQFAEALTRVYMERLQEKIEKARLAEAQLKEKEALERFGEVELNRKQLEAKRERKRLEKIQKQEERAFQEQLDQTTDQLRTRAEQLGYRIEEQVQGKKRVMVLVRRR